MKQIHKKSLGIYIHVPFCRSKCEYCDFYSLGGAKNRKLVDEYVYAVVRHLREAGPRARDYLVDTIYFGGGTPTFLDTDSLKRILGEIYRRFNVDRGAEVTLEANPDTADYRTLRRLCRAGFNRISIGVQSDNDDILKALGRPHTFVQGKQAVADARTAGFESISVDFMYGLPNQTRESWADTLRTIADFGTEHISCYGLTVQPGTPLYSYADCANLPDDDTQADMYLFLVSTLQSIGYRQYEISNFCREGVCLPPQLEILAGWRLSGLRPFRGLGLCRQPVYLYGRCEGLYRRHPLQLKKYSL